MVPPGDVPALISAKAGLKYTGRPVDAMKAVAQAHQERSLQAFQVGGSGLMSLWPGGWSRLARWRVKRVADWYFAGGGDWRLRTHGKLCTHRLILPQTCVYTTAFWVTGHLQAVERLGVVGSIVEVG